MAVHLVKIEIDFFKLSRDLGIGHVIKISCKFKAAASQSKPPSYPTKFSVHRHCVSRDIINFLCHVIPMEHANQGSCDFIGRGLSK